MRLAPRPILIGFTLFALWLAYVFYTFSGAYRARFQAKFDQVKVGDSYEQMVALLGKPDHYCPLERYVDSSTPGFMTTDTVAQVEIYRVGTWDFGVEFPWVGYEKRGPATRTVVSEGKTICPGRDNKH